MSYILKALKKSEAERAKGAVPRLTAQPAAAPRIRSAVWPWIVGGALLVNAAVVVLAWRPQIPLFEWNAAAPAPTNLPPVAEVGPASAPAAPANGEPVRSVAPAPPSQAQPAARQAQPSTALAQNAEIPAAATEAAAANDGEPVRSVAPAPPSRAQPAPRQAPPSEALAQNAEIPAVPAEAAPANNGEPVRPVAPVAPRQAQPSEVPALNAEIPAARPEAAPAPSTGQRTGTQQTAARKVGANDNDDAPPSDPTPQKPVTLSAIPRTPPTPAAPGTAAIPRPRKKPVEALALAARRLGPGDPVRLDGSSRAERPRGPELALAVPEPAPQVPEAQSEPDPYASVPMLWQLPSVIRSKLPKLSLSVHVFSPEPAGRFVIVDRRKYREGDVITGGVKLEAITVDGIVLDYQGRRYRIGN